MYLFVDRKEDAIRAVETATLSLMTGEKAATLSSAMEELTHVGRGVYEVVNRGYYIYMKDKSVSPPAIESIMVVYSIKEESKRSCVSKKFVARGCIAVKKSVEVEAKPGEPLSPAKNNMTEGRSNYSNTRDSRLKDNTDVKWGRFWQNSAEVWSLSSSKREEGYEVTVRASMNAQA